MKKGWQTKKLSDVCRFIDYRGKTPEKTASGMRLITAKNVKMGFLQREPLEYVAPESYDAWMTRGIPKEGDVLFTTEAPLANVAQLDTDERVVFAQRIIILQPVGSGLDRTFLKYLLLSDTMQGIIREKGTGATVQGIKASLLKEIEISFPPLAEQQRIVGLLDEAFEGLATAKANAEKNLQNARALFESHLQSVFTQRGPGWVDRTLDQVCIVERGSSPRPIKEYFTTEPDGVNWIKIGDTEEGGKYVYSTGQKITPEGAKQSRFVKEGDFILTNSMSYGRPYIMKTSGYIHDGWFVLRLNMAIDTDYFYYLLSSPVVQLQFASLASGSVVKNISGDLVKKAVLPIPPLEHQHVIVEKLMALEEETQRLARLCERKLAALEALKKSLLHEAFSGAL
jgi:type I restriction enzyme S subunit|uniref:restriction endonuclease subunit S n=1 Tax=Prosthecobacter sp. TaxID=1965333 RepID=UPI003784BBFC